MSARTEMFVCCEAETPVQATQFQQFQTVVEIERSVANFATVAFYVGMCYKHCMLLRYDFRKIVRKNLQLMHLKIH